MNTPEYKWTEIDELPTSQNEAVQATKPQRTLDDIHNKLVEFQNEMHKWFKR